MQNSKGDIVAGSTELQNLREYWVLERAFGKDIQSYWRICGKINPNDSTATSK